MNAGAALKIRKKVDGRAAPYLSTSRNHKFDELARRPAEKAASP
jgi:hypothetical protein